MTALTFSTELSIASGWDNTAGYSLITALLDSDSIPYLLPMPFEGFIKSTQSPRMSSRTYAVANKSFSWYFQGMTLKQLLKLDTDYQNTNDSKVTVRTVDFDGTYEDFNAHIVVPTNWQTMLGSKNGYATNTPGNYISNWLADVSIGFNVDSESA